MTSTIESLHIKIVSRISTLRKMIDILKADKVLAELNRVASTYNAWSLPILGKYYIASKDEVQELNESYIKFVTRENIESNLNILFDELVVMEKEKNTKSDKFNKLVHEYDTKIDDNDNLIIHHKFDVCCDEKMIINTQTSELRCLVCQHTKVLYGAVFEEYVDNNQRSKFGTYNPSRHCKFWVERIQARENNNIPDDVKERIIECTKRDKIFKQMKTKLNCEKIRSYLKELKLTKYNNHIALIRKEITGVVPYQLTHSESQELSYYFDLAINIFEKIKPSNVYNHFYYPHLLYKLILMLYKKHPEKLTLLESIHIQSHGTSMKNDRYFKQICDYQNKHRNDDDILFIYEPTDI